MYSEKELIERINDKLTVSEYEVILDLIGEFNLNIANKDEIESLILKLEEESQKIIIPKLLNTKTKIKRRVQHYGELTAHYEYEDINYYENDIKEDEVSRRKTEKKKLDNRVIVLKRVVTIIKFYNPEKKDEPSSDSNNATQDKIEEKRRMN